MFKEVMNDLWLARISSLSNEVGLYVVLLEVVRTIRSLVQGRITNSKIVLIVDLSLYLKIKKLLSVFPLFMTDMLSFLRTRIWWNFFYDLFSIKNVADVWSN
jgi:hypothetical protein